jgi:hypothetical protein
MIHLIQRGLMFGNLVHINSPALVERYNRALMHLTGKQTTLTDFHVDISGYSPEIGDELEDTQYLNHAGVNRQFILLTTDQKRAPLLNAKFSTSRTILRQFIEGNEPQLFALTARDAVAGELVNSVYSVDSPARIFDIRKITVEADTTSGTVRQAEDLARDVNRFLQEEDAWFDDVLIAQMISTAKHTGDVTRNPVRLNLMQFEQRNFWTAHFGGMYVFQEDERQAAITVRDEDAFEDLPIRNTYDLSDRGQIARFLEDCDLVEPIIKARGIDAAAILRQKMDFIVIDAAQESGVDLAGASRRDIRSLARRHAKDLPEEFHGLAALLRWAEEDAPWPKITSDHPAYFYTLRSADHGDRDLVNMLLAELAPKDVRQLFICHKELFYKLYAGWSETKKSYVADFLEREYQVDKAGAREALFGHDAAMVEDAPRAAPREGPWGSGPRAKPARVSEAKIKAVGPWGAVRR